MSTIYLQVENTEHKIIKNNAFDVCKENPRIDYKQKICVKPWGYEYIVYESQHIGIWHLYITKNHGTSLHAHNHKDTLIIVLSGTAKLTLSNQTTIALSPFTSVHIPKNKFHGLSCYSDNVTLLEIEIFDDTVKFSDKNDLLRIDDQYNRKKTGYESSVVLSDDYIAYNYFYLESDLKKHIGDTLIQIFTINTNDAYILHNGYNIVIDGKLFADGIYYGPGSLIQPHVEKVVCKSNDCMILSLQNVYANENGKIIYSLEHLQNIVSQLNENKKKLVLTSGCYDIIHIGHLHHLKKAKQLGDVLMVCLSSDNQIKSLKGQLRPVNNYEDRINLLKSIPYIDYIVLYDEEDIENETTLDKIMKISNPCIWTKGSDYSINSIICKHPHLHKIAIIDNIVGKSSTNIINTINET